MPWAQDFRNITMENAVKEAIPSNKPISLETDVKLLKEAFPPESLYEKRTISYYEIEEVLEYDRLTNSPRYYPVIRKFKDYLKKAFNIVLKTLTNVGYAVATNSQKIEIGINQRKQAEKRIKSSIETLNTVDVSKLNEEQKTIYDFNVKINGTIVAAMAMHRELPKPKI